MCRQCFEHLCLMQILFIALGRLHCLVDPALYHFQISQDKLHVNNVDIPARVCTALYMDDIFVVKAPYHMHDGIRRADISKELVAKALPFAGTFYKAGNIHKFNDGICHLFRVI